MPPTRSNVRRRPLWLESLEDRTVPSAAGFSSVLADLKESAQPFVVSSAGANSLNLLDRNLDSRFAGVGSIRVQTSAGIYLGTGTLISPRHVLTAAHLFDLNNDGSIDVGPTDVTFNLNFDTDSAIDSRVRAESVTLHPDFTGFAKPSLNDDLAILTLPEGAVPAGVPYYSLAEQPLTTGTPITFVGYGMSGDGNKGFTAPATFNARRVGSNVVDAFVGQDDAGKGSAREVFAFDFDGAGQNVLGGKSLGTGIESTLGPGDSGGPSFVVVGDPSQPSSYQLVGVNTFGASAAAPVPLFGSLAGGINVSAYGAWIESVVAEDQAAPISDEAEPVAAPADTPVAASPDTPAAPPAAPTAPANEPSSGEEGGTQIDPAADAQENGVLIVEVLSGPTVAATPGISPDTGSVAVSLATGVAVNGPVFGAVSSLFLAPPAVQPTPVVTGGPLRAATFDLVRLGGASVTAPSEVEATSESQRPPPAPEAREPVRQSDQKKPATVLQQQQRPQLAPVPSSNSNETPQQQRDEEERESEADAAFSNSDRWLEVGALAALGGLGYQHFSAARREQEKRALTGWR